LLEGNTGFALRFFEKFGKCLSRSKCSGIDARAGTKLDGNNRLAILRGRDLWHPGRATEMNEQRELVFDLGILGKRKRAELQLYSPALARPAT